ncbi:MAG: YigZ family protein [Moraxellaceae bacterium]|nr:MAG: YigZ family protein [Moraxellaceae bacterium]
MTSASPASSYNIPASSVESIYEIKKSRFISRTGYITNKGDAKAFLAQAKKDYPDARHHCWAYQFGPPHSPHSAAMSDAGEPSGTAGKPILNVLQHKDIGDIMVVVIRYFGGIKLGAGGLVRAYSHAAQLAIENLTIENRTATTSIIIECDFSQEQTVRHWLNKSNGQNIQANYQQKVDLSVELPLDQLSSIELQCKALGINIREI